MMENLISPLCTNTKKDTILVCLQEKEEWDIEGIQQIYSKKKNNNRAFFFTPSPSS